MPATLDYTASPAPRARRFAQEAAFIACVAAIAILCNSTLLASHLLTWGRCGTGRRETAQELFLIMPAACAIPAGCWYYLRGAGFATLLCRLSFLAASSGWLTAALFAARR